MDCKLCGLPAPSPPIEANGLSFCCIGCREVYRHFGEGDVATGSVRKTAEIQPPVPDGAEVYLRVGGMHCPSCEILIERVAEKVDGVLYAASSYATATAKIIYDPGRIDPVKLPELLSVAGYRVRLRGEAVGEVDDRLALLRLIAATSFAAVVMMLYLAFYYPSHLGLVERSDLEPVGWLAFYAVPRALFVLTSLQVFLVGSPIFRGAWIGLRVGVMNMDNLLVIAILAAYGYSVLQMVSGSLELYFDVSTAIVAVVTIGRYFEQGARAVATQELTKLMQIWSPRARVRHGVDFVERGVGDLKPGDQVLISQGEPVPVDGVILLGEAAVDESLMTGEPFPVTRGAGASVIGGALVVEGEITIEVGANVESQVDSLARVLWNLQSSFAGAHGLADRVARLFVPVVLALAVLVVAWSLLSGGILSSALLTGLATLIVSCPCTFGLAIPLTSAAGVSAALNRGIIVTSSDAFEKISRIDIVAIDKTGTLSTGEMRVVRKIGSPESVAYAAAVERLSAHPIARAIARLDKSKVATELAIHPGRGVVARVENRRVAVGGRTLFATLGWEIPNELAAEAEDIASDGEVISFVGWNERVQGAIATQDQSRPEWQELIDRLRASARVVLLTGAEHPSGYEDRVDEFFAGVPPKAKAAVIERLRAEGTVVMIGDGSNDAPALAAADFGIAFGDTTSLAADAADLVIPGDRLDRIFDAFEVIATTRRRVRQNLGWALLYNATAIPLAMSGFLNPLFAALAMSASSLLVVWNSSRQICGASFLDTMPVRRSEKFRGSRFRNVE